MSTPEADGPPPARTPLYEEHVRLGAKMVPFAGWEMPVQYTGVIDEVKAVRGSAGLFDVCHMGEFHVTGQAALAWLNSMTTNDVSRLKPGRAHYSLLLDQEAGIIDDILVYCVDDEHFMLVVNAGNTAKDFEWLEGKLLPGVKLEDASSVTALIAIQGPQAQSILQPLCTGPLSELRRFGFAAGEVAGIPCVISRTGYTGEDGFELFTQGDAAVLWNALLQEGGERLQPCGLGARDVLRIEAGNVLFGHEIWEEVNPLSAGLMWTVRMDKGPFMGSERLAEYVQAGAALTLVGLTSAGRAIPRQHYVLRHEGQDIGFVTSGTHSPTLGKPIGMAYLPPELAAPGTQVDAIIRERPEPMIVAELPFYRAKR
jgi:aminomethyltransferase